MELKNKLEEINGLLISGLVIPAHKELENLIKEITPSPLSNSRTIQSALQVLLKKNIIDKGEYKRMFNDYLQVAD